MAARRPAPPAPTITASKVCRWTSTRPSCRGLTRCSGRLPHGTLRFQVTEAPAELLQLGQAVLGGGTQPQQRDADGADGGPAGDAGGHWPEGVEADDEQG